MTSLRAKALELACASDTHTLVNGIESALRQVVERCVELCPRYCTCPPGTEMDHKSYCAYGIAATLRREFGEGP